MNARNGKRKERIARIVRFLFAGFFLAAAWTVPAVAQSMDGLADQYRREYEAVKPRPGSSVGTDYKLDQIAMGALYTVQSIAMLHDQTDRILRNQEAMIERYDRMIRQNDELVRLLRELTALRKVESGMAPDP